MRVIEIDSPQIEIVVVDNDSPDDTEKVINSIDDDRISYYKNQTNIGVAMNIIETIKKAKGEWVFLLSDEDTVEINTMDRIIKDLSTEDNSEIAVILGNVKNYDNSYLYQYKNAKYLRGDEAICMVGFSHHYMSGILINKMHIMVEELDGFTPDHGIYPQINIYTHACVSGDAITMDNDFCTQGGYVGHKSFIEKPNNEVYFHPINRFEQFKLFTKMANEIIENHEFRIKMLERLYFYYLFVSTYWWEDSIRSELTRNHYGVDKETKFDFQIELEKFNSKAKNYLNEIIDDPNIKENLNKAISRKMISFKMRRILKYIPKPLKKILRPLYRCFKKLRSDCG